MAAGDKVIGTAILDRSLRPQRLYFICHHHKGYNFKQSLPVCPVGTAAKHQEWMYSIHNDSIHVRPSLLIRGGPDLKEEVWHNDGYWIVKFEDGRYENLEEANPEVFKAGVKICSNGEY